MLVKWILSEKEMKNITGGAGEIPNPPPIPPEIASTSTQSQSHQNNLISV